MNIRPLISVLTPTWNRATYLERVWDGLRQQTYQNFEWLVANDGSEDDTIEVVKELVKKSRFPVTLINADRRIGKSRMDNELVRCAKGDFIIWCDSDDFLFPNALETLVNTWQTIPKSKRADFMGITALCDTAEEGVLGKSIPKEPFSDMTLNEIKLRIHADFVIFAKAEYLKNNPFLEVDYLISESSVWSIIGTKLTRFQPVILERKKYREPNCLSFSGVMEYNRGKAYSMAVTWRYVNMNISLQKKIRRMINFLRYAIHADIGLIGAFRLWSENTGQFLQLIPCIPMAYALILKDSLQGKVVKSHREFLVAKNLVAIDIQVLQS